MNKRNKIHLQRGWKKRKLEWTYEAAEKALYEMIWLEKEQLITINTDASYCQKTKIWAYAYWIKWDWFFYKWSGVFKEECKWSTYAEERAVMVAIWILKSKKRDFDTILVNRDCRGVWYRGELKGILDEYKRELKKEYWKKKRIVKFIWVKWHSNWETRRQYVNNWCDMRAKGELREVIKNFKNKI